MKAIAKTIRALTLKVLEPTVTKRVVLGDIPPTALTEIRLFAFIICVANLRQRDGRGRW